MLTPDFFLEGQSQDIPILTLLTFCSRYAGEVESSKLQTFIIRGEKNLKQSKLSHKKERKIFMSKLLITIDMDDVKSFTSTAAKMR